MSLLVCCTILCWYVDDYSVLFALLIIISTICEAWSCCFFFTVMLCYCFIILFYKYMNGTYNLWLKFWFAKFYCISSLNSGLFWTIIEVSLNNLLSLYISVAPWMFCLVFKTFNFSKVPENKCFYNFLKLLEVLEIHHLPLPTYLVPILH